MIHQLVDALVHTCFPKRLPLFCLFSGDAVWTNRRECLYLGFPVSFLSSAGICCCLGQRDSKAEVKGLLCVVV